MKTRSEYGAWMRASTDFWLLGIEAWSVMALRTMKIASGGPGSEAELGRMFSEKMTAAIELQARLVTGGLSTTPLGGAQATIRHYRKKVAANSKRLRGSGR